MDFNEYYGKFRPVLISQPRRRCEVLITSELARILKCRTEVQAPYELGRIDCLSKDWLIESKYENVTNEKHALGQLLLYSYGMRFKGSLGLALIGKSGRPRPGIHKYCIDNQITIFYYNLNTLRWTVFYDATKETLRRSIR